MDIILQFAYAHSTAFTLIVCAFVYGVTSLIKSAFTLLTSIVLAASIGLAKGRLIIHGIGPEEE